MRALIVLLVGLSLAASDPEAEEHDGAGSRKILGSSVVTSVSVIMDVGNGSQTYYSDAVGKPVSKPSMATQLASPINLLNPDRYEFYTFGDNGDLVKRLMTLDEIQGIIASGDGEATNYNSQPLIGDEPEKGVDDIVNNVQNVLKEEIEAHKTAMESRPPPHNSQEGTSTWNMILPAIFSNPSDVILPEKQHSGVTAETIMLEHTTLLPPIAGDSLSGLAAANQNSKFTIRIPEAATPTSQESANQKTEADAPIISVEISSDVDKPNTFHDTANFSTSEKTSTYDATKASQVYSFKPTITISSPAPFTTNAITTKSTTPKPVHIKENYTKQTIAPITPIKFSPTTIRTQTRSTTLPQSPTASTTPRPSSTSVPTTISTLPPSTISLIYTQPTTYPSTVNNQLSTFFIIEDNKRQPEKTTSVYSTPMPFTLNKATTTQDQQQSSATTSSRFSTTTDWIKETVISTTELYSPTTDKRTEINTQEPTTTQQRTKIMTTTTNEETTPLTNLYPQTTTQDLKLGTTEGAASSQTTYEGFTELRTQTTQTLTTEKPNEPEVTSSTTEGIKSDVTELLNQLVTTTNLDNLNSDLLTSNSQNFRFTTNPATTTKESETTTATFKPENISQLVTNSDLASSIDKLLFQAINDPEQQIDTVEESQKVNQMIVNSNSQPMNKVQAEAATAASSLIGIPNTETALKTVLTNEDLNQAVDSLISQIIYEAPNQTTSEYYLTTERDEASTTTSNNVAEQTSTFNNNETNYVTVNAADTIDDKNRYEEIDLTSLEGLTTVNYESKTAQTEILSTNTRRSEEEYTSENPNVTPSKLTTSTELNLEENQYKSTLYPETLETKESTDDTFITSTKYYSTESTPNSIATATTDRNSEFIMNDDKVATTETSVDVTSKNNELLNLEESKLNENNYNDFFKDTSKPFLIVTSSDEYSDYVSTENTQYTDSSEIAVATVTHSEFSTTNGANDTEESETPTFQTTKLSQTTEPENILSSTTEYKYQTTEINTENNLYSEPTTTVKHGVFSTETTEESFTTVPTTTTAAPTSTSTTQRSTTPWSAFIATAFSTQRPRISLSEEEDPSTNYQAYINLPMITAAPKIDKPPELKLIQTPIHTTFRPDMTWTLVPTVAPHRTTTHDQSSSHQSSSVDLVPKPLQGFGLEDSTSALDTDIFQFTELCNELAFSFWSSVTSGISFARSVVISPFAATSMLAMVFLGARGSTSGEMNEILKLDDMVTFNPHSIFKNVIESIEVSKRSGVAVSVFIKELYSDKNKGKLLNFYKDRVKQFYDGHVEEVNFREINDVIRRRTNLLVKRQTWGKIQEYLKDSSLFVRPPLAAVSANIFETDCSGASTEGHDGELHFVVLPSIRQRKLVPVPAVVWRSNFLAGYDPGLDATAVAVGTKDQTISTIFVIPGQQGISAPGDSLIRLEARLIESAFRQGAWSRLLRSLIPRPGLEVQIPRFSHKSVINATMALQRMGLKDLFNSHTADLKGLNGVAHELYLSDIIQVNTFATCGEGRIDETHHSEVYPATTIRSFRRIRKLHHYHVDRSVENSDILEEPRDYQRAFHDPLYDPSYLSLPLQLRPRQARLPEIPRLRFDRPFLYFVRHNPTGLILHMGRFNPRLLP